MELFGVDYDAETEELRSGQENPIKDVTRCGYAAAMWTLGYTSTNVRGCLRFDSIIHMDCTCSSMTSPQHILIHQINHKKCKWCFKCRDKPGVLFGPRGIKPPQPGAWVIDGPAEQYPNDYRSSSDSD